MASAEPNTPQNAPPRLRADARRNRDRLIEAAATAFAENGVEASLEDIARQAGVGIGTLYRHFPTREHLVEIIYRRELENLAAAAAELSKMHPPDVALEEWMHRFVGYIATKRGLSNSLRILMTSDSTLFAEGFGNMRGALADLLKVAGEKGYVRTDVDAADVMHAMTSIYSIPASPEWRDRSHRLITLLMDGLRTRR